MDPTDVDAPVQVAAAPDEPGHAAPDRSRRGLLGLAGLAGAAAALAAGRTASAAPEERPDLPTEGDSA
ncbi:MAG: deferrochelatase/peroxidase EfeB, partial [Actinomycetota bacterium]